MDWKREKVGPIKSFPDAFISIFLFSISIFWFEEISSQMVAVVCLWWAVDLFGCSVFEHRLCDYFSEAYGGLLPTAPSPPPRDCLRPVTNQFSVRPQPLTPAIFGQIFLKNGEIWPFLKIWSKGSKNGFLLRISTHVPTLDTSPWHPSQKLWNL